MILVAVVVFLMGLVSFLGIRVSFIELIDEENGNLDWRELVGRIRQREKTFDCKNNIENSGL